MEMKTINRACVGFWITGVTGSTGAYDITLDNGEVLTAYDETAGSFSTAVPAANDLVAFGIDGGSRAFAVANAEVIPAAQASNWLGKVDPAA